MKWEVEFGMLTVHAASLHVKHTRKGPRKGQYMRVPYLIHMLQVLQRAQRWGIDAPTPENCDFWKGLLFHDSIEDTIATYDYLIGLIGKKASDIVMELTNTMDEDTGDYMHSFATKSIEAVVGKIADRLSNVDDFYVDDPGYALRYLHKADAVFEVYNRRKDEVIARFGYNVTDKIDNDINSMLEKLADCQMV